MASLVDVKIEQGDPKRVAQELAEAAAQEATTAKPVTDEGAVKPAAAKSDDDPRFAGKSREDLLDMYRNLESHTGRLANEMGQTKRSLDELLIDKRARDLNANGALKGNDEIDPTDLLVKPKEVLDKYVNTKSQAAIEPLAQRLNNLEAALLNNSFTARHADVNQVTATPEFKNWVNQTSLRQQLAANAAGGNLQAADALLTEYKATVPAKAAAQGKHLEAALEAAGKVSLEGSSSGDPASKPAGKTFRRNDLIALRMRNPDEYEKLAPQIEAAYREGRVV